MKQRLFKGLSLMLTLIFILGIFPITALAADNEDVLISLSHTSAVSAAVNAANDTVTLTVPYTYTGDVVLSSGLDISYDTSVYASASAGFPDGAIAVVGGTAVKMLITYQRKDDAAQYTTEYALSVVRAAPTSPTFSGSILKSVSLPNILTFTVADFSEKYVINEGGALASIVITGSDPSFGSLKLGNDSALGSIVTLSDLQNGNLTFVPNDAGTVSYTVSAYAYDTAASVGTAVLTITANDASVDSITYTTDENTPVSFKAPDFEEVCAEVTGGTLSYVQFTLPAPDGGTLYYNYTSSSVYDSLAASDTKYYYSAEPNLSNVHFVPAADSAGTVIISYTGYSTADVSFSGEIIVNVGEKENSDHFGDVGKNLSWAVEAIDYLYEQGILTGDGNGYYNPQASISKGDFLLMLCRAFDLESDYSSNFSDVDEDDYFCDAVGTAKKLGIAKGSNGKFNPRSALSRQDAMVLITRALEVSGVDLPSGADSDLQPFTDKHKISNYAKDAFEALVKAGIIEGSGRLLNPKSSVSRAEIAVILYRVLTV